MAPTVFIAHKNEDTVLAGQVAFRLQRFHQVGVYIDVIDPHSGKAGEELGDYLRGVMSDCTQLLAVVSEKTKESWWVPWEIGVATEKSYPVATYSPSGAAIPLYLKKWPYLRSLNELDIYAEVSKIADRVYQDKRRFMEKTAARRTASQDFYTRIRARLGQI